MAFDDDLAARVRDLVQSSGVIEEKRMFGGLAFMVDGRTAVCVSGTGGLLVPVGDELEALTAHAHVEPMTMGARVSGSWAHVLPAALATDVELSTWVERGLAVSRRPR